MTGRAVETTIRLLTPETNEGGRGEGGGVMKNKKNAGWMKRGEMEEAGGGGGRKEGKGKKYGGRAIVIAAESFCRGIFQNDWAP